MKYAAVVFDIDNTLYDYDAAHKVAFRALTAYASEAFGLAPERFEELHGRTYAQQKRLCGENCAAIHNRLIRFQMMLEAIGQPIAFAPTMSSIYWSGLIGAMTPSPGLIGLMPRLKAMGLKVGVGTNMTADIQFAKLERLGVLRDVDFMVSSEEINAEKPDRRLFDRCVEKAGCRADACVYVGDSLQKDVFGAENAGLRAVWFRPVADGAALPKDVACITSLGHLPDLLASIS